MGRNPTHCGPPSGLECSFIILYYCLPLVQVCMLESSRSHIFITQGIIINLFWISYLPSHAGGIVNNTLRPTIPNYCDAEWRTLMEQCWAPNPAVRPSFTEIASRLRVMSAAAAPSQTKTQGHKKWLKHIVLVLVFLPPSYTNIIGMDTFFLIKIDRVKYIHRWVVIQRKKYLISRGNAIWYYTIPYVLLYYVFLWSITCLIEILLYTKLL